MKTIGKIKISHDLRLLLTAGRCVFVSALLLFSFLALPSDDSPEFQSTDIDLIETACEIEQADCSELLFELPNSHNSGVPVCKRNLFQRPIFSGLRNTAAALWRFEVWTADIQLPLRYYSESSNFLPLQCTNNLFVRDGPDHDAVLS